VELCISSQRKEYGTMNAVKKVPLITVVILYYWTSGLAVWEFKGSSQLYRSSSSSYICSFYKNLSPFCHLAHNTNLYKQSLLSTCNSPPSSLHWELVLLPLLHQLPKSGNLKDFSVVAAVVSASAPLIFKLLNAAIQVLMGF
jgi:hypothetical protein